MRIQNKNLGETEITLRFTHHDGERVRIRGDARGIFDMPARDAEFLLTTPGWSPVREATSLDPAEPPAVRKPENPPAVRKPENLKPSAPGAPPVAPPSAPAPVAPAAPSDAAESKAEAAKIAALKAEVDSLRSKADALAFAELHEIKGVEAEMKLSEMKEKITAELFVTEED